jgi:hypothetical protein
LPGKIFLCGEINDFLAEENKVKPYACVAGLPDGIFQTKNLDLGKFLRALEWKRYICIYIGHLE